MKNWRAQFPEIGTAVALVNFVLAILNALQTASGVGTLGISAAWWSLIFFLAGTIIAMLVIRGQRAQITSGQKRHIRDQRSLASRDRRIAALEDELRRSKDRSQELGQELALANSRSLSVDNSPRIVYGVIPAQALTAVHTNEDSIVNVSRV